MTTMIDRGEQNRLAPVRHGGEEIRSGIWRLMLVEILALNGLLMLFLYLFDMI